jgi:hypothetical protein
MMLISLCFLIAIAVCLFVAGADVKGEDDDGYQDHD